MRIRAIEKVLVYRHGDKTTRNDLARRGKWAQRVRDLGDDVNELLGHVTDMVQGRGDITDIHIRGPLKIIGDDGEPRDRRIGHNVTDVHMGRVPYGGFFLSARDDGIQLVKAMYAPIIDDVAVSMGRVTLNGTMGIPELVIHREGLSLKLAIIDRPSIIGTTRKIDDPQRGYPQRGYPLLVSGGNNPIQQLARETGLETQLLPHYWFQGYSLTDPKSGIRVLITENRWGYDAAIVLPRQIEVSPEMRVIMGDRPAISSYDYRKGVFGVSVPIGRLDILGEYLKDIIQVMKIK